MKKGTTKKATTKKPAAKKATSKKETPAQVEKINVKVGAFPGGQIKPFEVDSGTTIRQALVIAGYRDKIEGEVRLNGQTISNFEEVLEEGAQVLIFSKIRGN
ncbi:MAG: hypothetical protein WC087_00990 [Candidatus Paceibacterota bacterium]